MQLIDVNPGPSKHDVRTKKPTGRRLPQQNASGGPDHDFVAFLSAIEPTAARLVVSFKKFDVAIACTTHE